MWKLRKAVFISIFLAIGIARAERVEVFSEGKTINFYLKENTQSMIEFPEPIAQVITSYPEGVASYSVSDNKFFFLLSSFWEGLVFVIGESGKTYPILIKEVGENQDVCLKIDSRVSTFKMSISSKMEEALKQLFQGKTKEGVWEKIDTVFFKDKNITITGERLFRFTSGFIGIEALIKNTSKGQIVIPTTQIAIPELVAISVDKEVLNPKETTKAYLLFIGN
ncbi:MAG TPA: hypothetical protein P5150_02525 [Candidatus Ratteibacteria bacterium]|nr:hypothetical protein [Candidatus Ratteibacteria bacterium]